MAEILLPAGIGVVSFAAGFVIAAITTAAKTGELERRLRLSLRTLREISRDDNGPAGDTAMRALGTDLELTTTLSRRSSDALD